MDDNIIEIVNNDYIIEIEEPSYDLQVENLFISDYTYSINKPAINSFELIGNKTSEDLGLVSQSAMIFKENVSNKVTDVDENSTDVEYPSAKCLYEKTIDKADINLSNISVLAKNTIAELISNIFNDIYPIGALYITSNASATCPMANLFGTWELVAQDRVLQGAGVRGTVGSTLPESLPNTSGNMGNVYTGRETKTGCFSGTSTSAAKNSTWMNTGTATAYQSFNFNASNSSSVYQDNAHVQPSAYLVNIWKRTA